MSEKQVALLASVVALVLAAVAALALVVAFAAQEAATKAVTDVQVQKDRADRIERQLAQLTTNLIALGPILEVATGTGPAKAESAEDPASVLSVGAPATEAPASVGPEESVPAEIAPGGAEPVKPNADIHNQTPAPQVEQASPAAPAAESPAVSKPVAQGNLDEVLAQRIMANWQKPTSAKPGMSVDILIKIGRDGTVNEATVVKSSGDVPFDSSATDAILGVKSLPEMSQVSDKTYNELYKERRVSFAPLPG
ncbi:TonB family protein [Pseudomonas sp. NCHU5208]|uniref:TonB family protein n=1 Tax=unclassified Pseudomonas TaxID=196821 RepID=UPI003F9E149F